MLLNDQLLWWLAAIVFVIGLSWAFALTFSGWSEGEARPIRVATGMNVLTGLAAASALIGLYVLQGTLQATQKAARAAAESNKLAQENAATELRAYLSVQAERGDDAVKLVSDPKTNETRVSISFFNAGQTPAHEFHISIATGGVSKSTGKVAIGQISRYVFVGSGSYSGGVVSSHGIDIPAKSAHVENVASDQMPTEQEWNEIKLGKKKFYLQGNYEYCDEFGGYHCRMLSFDYTTSPQRGFVPSAFMDMECGIGPVVPPHQPAPVKVLRRCPDIKEREQADAYADSNAGKTFPAHPELLANPIPTPTK